MLTDTQIGQEIKASRLRAGLTQTQLGERLGVGPGAVNKWELGKVTNLKRTIMRGLALEIGISPAILIGIGG